MKAIILYREQDGEIEGGIYNNISYEDVVREVGERNIISYIALQVSGKSYAERKGDLEDKAIMYSYTWSEYCYSYGELFEVQNFFEVNGKRYGLIREFRENAIC